MSYSYTERKGDGTARTFNFSFAGEDKGYIKATDIVVETSTTDDYKPVTNWVLSGTNQITFDAAPAAGLNIRIRRVVDKEKPYAKFDRNVTLDMVSLNNSFIQMLQVIQEIMDGFIQEGFFYKNNLNMGGHRIINLAPGIDGTDAINKDQYDVVVNDNIRQDQEIDSIKEGLVSGVAHRTIPWYFRAKGGETKIIPPFQFDGCIIFIDGVAQFEQAGAYTLADSTITLAEPLERGQDVLVLLGSRLAPPINDVPFKELNVDVDAGTLSVPLTEGGADLDVKLDGLYQPVDSYTVSGRTITFSEPLPKCRVTVKYRPTT